jgi:hypothetical protein
MLSAYDTHPAGAPQSVQWSARVRLNPRCATTPTVATAYVRDHTLPVANPISFKPSGDIAPSALETLLAALGGELATGFVATVSRRGLILDALELTVSCYLENPLVAARVVGEEGSPAIAAMGVTLYIASPEMEDDLQSALAQALPSLPVYTTLTRACPVTITLKIIL